jgi:hypothetical protein
MLAEIIPGVGGKIRNFTAEIGLAASASGQRRLTLAGGCRTVRAAAIWAFVLPLQEVHMRVFLKASMTVDTGNQAIRSGKLPETIQAILDEQKPEAAYFIAEGGTRTALLFLDIQDASQLPALAEPWFLAFNAAVEVTPAMTVADLAKAGPAIEKVVRKYGAGVQSAAAR